jgi:hypothetical protein
LRVEGRGDEKRGPIPQGITLAGGCSAACSKCPLSAFAPDQVRSNVDGGPAGGKRERQALRKGNAGGRG